MRNFDTAILLKLQVICKLMTMSCLVVISSCTPSRLETALEKAGDNRDELESVLLHYSEDVYCAEHLKAAIFLIENMPGHCTLSGGCMPDFIAAVDSLYPEMPAAMKSVIYTIPQRDDRYNSKMHPVEDVTSIKSSWLIRHIDNMMEARRQCPWIHNLPFDEFCEYVLPYRFAEEPLAETPDTSVCWWKEILLCTQKYDCLNYDMDDLRSLQRMLVGSSDNTYRQDLYLPVINEKHSFDCLDDCYYSVAMLRSCGVPCAIDFVTDWPTRNGRHFWRIIIDPHYKDGVIAEARSLKAAKVYRQMFSRVGDATEEANETEMPFLSPFVMDVTHLYMDCEDVTVKTDKSVTGTEKPCLAVFNTLEWHPVAAGTDRGGKWYFPSMGKNAVYLPVCTDGDDMEVAGYPFLFDSDGNMKPFVPQKETISVTMHRKYPLNISKLSWSRHIEGCRLEASDAPDFKNVDTVIVIEDGNPWLNWQEVAINKSSRYWRLVPEKRLNLGELLFLDSIGNILQGKLISDSSNSESMTNPAFDGNVLTYSNAHGWIGMDFGRRQHVGSIKIITRTDDNGIRPGSTYEFAYWDIDGEHKIGQKVAESDYIEFESVPAGALYWLKDLDEGIEERIFSIEDGTIHYY